MVMGMTPLIATPVRVTLIDKLEGCKAKYPFLEGFMAERFSFDQLSSTRNVFHRVFQTSKVIIETSYEVGCGRILQGFSQPLLKILCQWSC